MILRYFLFAFLFAGCAQSASNEKIIEEKENFKISQPLGVPDTNKFYLYGEPNFDSCFVSNENYSKPKYRCKDFYESGELAAIYDIDHDSTLYGRYELYYKNGKVKSKGMYFNGFLIGENDNFDSLGRKTHMQQFTFIKNGEQYLNSYIYYNKNGEINHNKSKYIRIASKPIVYLSAPVLKYKLNIWSSFNNGEFFIGNSNFDTYFNSKNEIEWSKLDTSKILEYKVKEKIGDQLYDFVIKERFLVQNQNDSVYSYYSIPFEVKP